MAARITQTPVLIVGLPTSQKARITQAPTLIVGLPTSQKARITQITVLCIAEGSSPPGGKNYGFWGLGAIGIGGGGPNVGIFGD
ncbi:MAG: hypothetical protein ABIH23_01930 [bacterium]